VSLRVERDFLWKHCSTSSARLLRAGIAPLER